MEKKILQILQEVRHDVEFEKETKLIDDGILDSFDIITLITQIREEFDIVVPAEQILPQNFNSADALAKLVWELLEEE